MLKIMKFDDMTLLENKFCSKIRQKRSQIEAIEFMLTLTALSYF